LRQCGNYSAGHAYGHDSIAGIPVTTLKIFEPCEDATALEDGSVGINS
uniref:Rap-GAP domain-containing protein n=1 Tax=Parascaris univalens TaxID=6257 RepID=A0A915ARS1_PARUN